MTGPQKSARRARIKSSAKVVSQIMTALKNSDNEAGPTMSEIVKFVALALAKPATKRQICTALKRGVDFGILKRKRGHYLSLVNEDDSSKLGLSGKLACNRYPSKVDKATRRAPLRALRTPGSSSRSIC